MNAVEAFLDQVRHAPVLGDVVLTGGFLNHRVDAPLLAAAAAEFAATLPRPDVVLTSEAGGIAPAFAIALAFAAPLVFARRHAERVPGDVWQVDDDGHHLVVSRDALPAGSNVLLVEDVLGNGRTPAALARLVTGAGSHALGFAAFVEKSFQPGRARLESSGVRVFSLARVTRDAAGIAVSRGT